MKSLAPSVIFLAALLLAACSSTPTPQPTDTTALETEAANSLALGDARGAADIYRELVDRSAGDERRRLLIDLARTQVALGDPEAALVSLAAADPLPEALRADAMAVRAEALFAQGRTVAAVQELVDRGVWLDTAADIIANQSLIWDGLALPQTLETGTTRTGDAIIDGWLALTPLTRLITGDEAFMLGLVEWRREFGAHPAAAGILAERIASLRIEGASPRRIALLLPLSSTDIGLQRRARALLEGFMAAHFAADGVAGTEVRFIDTTPGSVAAYRSALASGADFIVGPLVAESVRQVAPEAGFVPTLALNVGTEQPQTATNFFQFALSSEDEVAAISARAVATGHQTAIVLHAPNERGRRIRDNFVAAFEERGGSVIDSREYRIGAPDLAAPILAALNIGFSQARYDILSNALGVNLQFEPRRRADIDMIFLQADPDRGPEDARLLVPLLARNGAGDIPVYATSDVYNPTRVGGGDDLDGLLFPDLPLLVDPSGTAKTAVDQLDRYRSQSINEFPRLYAFGFDAYQLVLALYGGDPTRWPLAGATGQLQVDANGRIRRILPFARLTGGQPEPADPSTNLLSAR